MTDKELKALKEAFDFPEPDKKQEFLEEFSKLSQNNDKKRIPPIVMRFAAAAAMIAVIIGVLTHMPKDTTDFGNGNDGIVTVTHRQLSQQQPQKGKLSRPQHQRSQALPLQQQRQ